jgi:hypothetical protein
MCSPFYHRNAFYYTRAPCLYQIIACPRLFIAAWCLLRGTVTQTIAGVASVAWVLRVIDEATSASATTSSRRAARGLGLSLVGAYVALVPVDANDFWWHLKAGQLVASEGLPTTQRFAWTLPSDAAYTYATWLGEWLFYALYNLGGLQLTVFARNLLALLAFGVLGLEAQRRSGSWRLAALVVVLAGAMCSNNLSARTQNWSWLPFAVYVLVLSCYSAGAWSARALLALPLLMAFWVNAHGAFVLGLGLIGLFVVGETLRRLGNALYALPWPRLRALYAAAAATLAATLLNPQGWAIFGYVRDLLTDAPSQQLINEWQPPTVRSFAGAVFFATLLLLVVAWAYSRHRPTMTDVLVVCAFTWLAWSGMRYVVWWALAALPILAQSLARLRAAKAPLQPARGGAASWLPALLLGGMLVALQPWFKPHLGLPQPYQALFAPLPGAPGLFSHATPVEAVEYLRSNPGGRLFNEMGYGSYLIWALPEQGVFIDPRVELYPLAQWHDYVAISAARDYNRLLEMYGADRILLSRALQPKLANALHNDPLWVREYRDRYAEVWRRR